MQLSVFESYYCLIFLLILGVVSLILAILVSGLCCLIVGFCFSDVKSCLSFWLFIAIQIFSFVSYLSPFSAHFSLGLSFS